MGHLFRALNLSAYLKSQAIDCLIITNPYKAATSILDNEDVAYETVDIHDTESSWEEGLINKYGIDVWINDRLNTPKAHANRIKNSGLALVTFDDRGEGASIADLHFAPLIFNEPLQGNKVFKGVDYLVLNKSIDQYRHQRHECNHILVSMGGSDTYGASLKVVEQYNRLGKPITVLTGPGFKHQAELEALVQPGSKILTPVPSLMVLFNEFDLLVTGGGVTPFEANASGLPCIVIANEWFETPVCEYLESLGGSVLAGFHEEIDNSVFEKKLDIPAMSQQGMDKIRTSGADNILREMQAL